jgi:hypothetical protein
MAAEDWLAYMPSMLPNRYRGPPMALGNMGANGARSLTVRCLLCHHQAVLAVDEWPDHLPVPSFGPCMACTRCGIIGADVRPNWSERSTRPTPDRSTVALMAKRPTADMTSSGCGCRRGGSCCSASRPEHRLRPCGLDDNPFRLTLPPRRQQPAETEHAAHGRQCGMEA